MALVKRVALFPTKGAGRARRALAVRDTGWWNDLALARRTHRDVEALEFARRLVKKLVRPARRGGAEVAAHGAPEPGAAEGAANALGLVH